MPVRKTPRLVVRDWRRDDLDALASIYATPEVMRFIGSGSVLTRDQTSVALDRMQQEWVEQGFGKFAVEVRETRELAGWVGLAVPTFLPEVLPAVEIGWRLGRSFWGAGIATEAAHAVLRFAFEDLDLDRIVGIRHVANERSGRVMIRLGMTFDRSATSIHGVPVEVYALTRSQYLAGDTHAS